MVLPSSMTKLGSTPQEKRWVMAASSCVAIASDNGASPCLLRWKALAPWDSSALITCARSKVSDTLFSYITSPSNRMILHPACAVRRIETLNPTALDLLASCSSSTGVLTRVQLRCRAWPRFTFLIDDGQDSTDFREPCFLGLFLVSTNKKSAKFIRKIQTSL